MNFNKTEENLNNLGGPITLYTLYILLLRLQRTRTYSLDSHPLPPKEPLSCLWTYLGCKKYSVLDGSFDQHVEESRGLVWGGFQDADTGVIRPLDKLYMWKVTVDKVHKQDDPALPS